MKLGIATEPARAGRENEDFVAAVPGAVVLLDGAGSAGADSGCKHGVAWYSRQLGARLVFGILESETADLRAVLSEAISAVADTHRHECDLSHPGTPSATVLLMRTCGDYVDYLALADSTLIVQGSSSSLTVVTDDREEHVGKKYRHDMDATPNGSEEHALALKKYIESMRHHRNQEGGFWVASTDPDAAAEAIVGQVESRQVRALALLSDGATRLVDRFDLMSWDGLMDLLEQGGPEELIRRTREAERSDEHGRRWPRGKAYDDASAAYVRLAP
ncbi:protein phosphatase 2C domain-containing protein [Crossiella sp. CA198]|uniref:protein phosphatase 2C domain-containing protein n=1 Tax=Crossiella sp. CA198 TaxID=3455607 RepID=UPI003F8D37A6